jgi:hypothetical protein
MPGRSERGASEAGGGGVSVAVGDPWPAPPLLIWEWGPHPPCSLRTRSSPCIQVGRVEDGAGD